MFRIWLPASVIGGAALAFAATGASAGILGPGLDALRSAAPRSGIEKVHEGKGGNAPALLPAREAWGLPGLSPAPHRSQNGRMGDQTAAPRRYQLSQERELRVEVSRSKPQRQGRPSIQHW